MVRDTEGVVHRVTGVQVIGPVLAAGLGLGDTIRIAYRGTMDIGYERTMKLFEVYTPKEETT